MKRFLFILAVLAILLATAVLLYPKTNGPWTGYVQTSQGKFVADSSHQSLDDCRKYVQSQSGGKCGLDCTTGTQCKQLVDVP
jgi:uncharacterized protein YxeA